MMKKRIISIFLAMLMLASLLSFTSCKETTYENPTAISFKSALSYDYLKTLDNTPVTINGYMATSSPVDGSYIYLMNLPYQSCPFCLPNTSQLSNTMAVYAFSGEKFTYTDQAIKITGILDVSDSADAFFTDYYGYEFNFRIVNAYCTVLDESELGEKSLWTDIAESDIITEIYSMYDYLNFLTRWYTYTMQFESGKDYLYPEDAMLLVTTDGYQFNYGFKEGYFEGLRQRVRQLNPTELTALIDIIDKAEVLATDAYSALSSGIGNDTVYKSVYKYSEEFGTYKYQYEYLDSTLQTRYDALFDEFSTWMSSFEF